MKGKDILDALGEIDQDMIEDAAPVNCRVAGRKGYIRRWISVAACAALIVGGVMASRPLWEDGMNPSVSDTEEGNDGNLSRDDTDFPQSGMEEELTEAEQDAPIESGEACETYGELSTEYCSYLQCVGGYEEYQDYSLTFIPCSEDRVGEKIAEINVNYSWSHAPDDIIVCNADVYEVIGRDGSISLCYKYTEANGLYDTEEYYYMNITQASFDRLSELFTATGIDENASFDEVVNYNKKSQYCYCDRFTISEKLAKEIMTALKSCDGEVNNDITYSQLLSLSDERVSFGFSQSGYSVYTQVMANGYIYCSVLGQHIFYVGPDAAQKIIDLVLSGEPEGYVWNEEYSEWYTICEEDEIRENPPESFQEMLELRGVNETLTLGATAKYLASKINNEPPYFTLDDVLLENIADIISHLDGERLSPYDVPGNAYECVRLTVIRPGEETLELYIYSAGYISFGGFDYNVGEGNVEKIISTVVAEGVPAPGYYWDENTQSWAKGEVDESYPPAFGKDEDTFPYDTVPIEDVETETATEIMSEIEEETSH